MKFIKTFLFKPQLGSGVGSNGVACTPDGGFLYIGAKSVNYIAKPEGENPLIKVFNTKQPIVAIDIDPCWNTKGKIFATLTSEKSVLIWDFDNGFAISGHKAHCRIQSKAVEGAEQTKSTVHISFMKNRNLLSIGPNDLVVYCVASNSICVRPKFAPGKGQILTALKCSPCNEHIFALGTNRGQVYICDLQKSAVLYTLGRHQAPVASLSWNLMELPCETQKTIKTSKPPLVSNSAVEETDDIFNIYNYDYLENEFGAPPKTDTSQDVETNTMSNEMKMNPNFNFQEACESLKQEINALNRDFVEDNVTVECEAVTLEDCLNTKNKSYSISMDDSESTEGSLELIDRSSSSDENCHVDGREVDIKKTPNEQENGSNACKKVNEANISKNDKSSSSCGGKYDILLASASNDGHIWIWNTETGGCCDNLKGATRKKSKEFINVNINWSSSTELYGIDSQGDIHQWALSPNSPTCFNLRRTYKFEKVPIDRSEIKALAFGVSKNMNYFWYISDKREIICENIKTSETILCYATATTNIMVARESPENNSKIAFAFADRRIALLETSQLSTTKVVIRYLPARLNTFARVLTWSDDGCNIAYGTFEGQVGYINIDTQKHITFHTIYGKPIYSIIWRGNQIFMTCNDKLFAYEIENREPLTIQGVKDGISTVSLHKNFMLVGTNRGYIEIYREERATTESSSRMLSFSFIQSVEVAKHYITEIAWNPLKESEFAVVATEGNINILSINSNEGTATVIRKVEFGMPKASISSVKWSNRESQKFVTCGFDGALRIFDLSRQEKNELIFVKQFNCPLYSTMLLPRDERYAICTGKSITVEIVDTSQSEDAINPMKNESTLDHIKWAAKINFSNLNSTNKKKEKLTTKKATVMPDELTEKVAELSIAKCTAETDERQISKNNSNFLKTPQTLMHLITKEHNKNPLEKLQNFLNPSGSRGSNEEVLVSRLFGKKQDAEKVLSAELEKMKGQTTLAELGSIFMSQIKGDLRDVILKAIQARELSEWHIALAPTVSYGFWQKCCRAFAEQLLEQGYALQAATYMLGLHNQREAINMLIKANYFKEALLIARVYLSENDPIINDIVNKWIEQLENHGNLPGAALICAVSRQYMKGYEILSKQRVIGPEETSIINLLKEKGTS